ncbi:carbohydrate kinase family protein [uncultured Methanosphaera sp.]|uniref:carbohydrate kinase family protein n=1 Tax=uncultured Methanosphaera sp. TaxID=262501 RepID=UPI000DC250ED|nr:carbohydrate kinase family protein [uncultured Methanosphaera sp.]RAP44312.1 MAG: sugar kinase [Methanosphaera sp. SHI1033]
MKNVDLLVLGHTAFDYIMQVKEFSKINTSAIVEKMETFNGGAAGNVAVVASKLGLDVGLISCIGKDFKDSDYEQLLLNQGIDISDMIVSEDANTPTAFVLTNPDDEQMFYFYWGAAEKYQTSEVPKEAIDKARAVHLATGDPQYNIKAGKYAYSQNKLVSFDPGQDLHLYTTSDLEELTNNCNILFGNEHEIEYICDLLECTIDDLLSNGPNMVVQTLGDKGSLIYVKEEDPIKIDAVKTKAYDPTGAGDSYKAAFLSLYLHDNNLETCGRYASAVSSYIVETQGTQTNIPTSDQALERMTNQWPEMDL